METKKSKNANLENKRGMFLEIGLVLSLGMVLGILEWTSAVKPAENLAVGTPLEDDMIEIPVTIREELQKVVPPPPVVHEIILVDDREELDDEFKLEEFGEMDDPYEIIPYIETEKNVDDGIFTVVEDMPKFMGGDQTAFWAYVTKKLKYPELAIDYDIEGLVIVQFVVDKKGNITDMKILRSADDLLSNEVKRVIASCPKWEPGKQREKPVNVAFTMPFNFKLN